MAHPEAPPRSPCSSNALTRMHQPRRPLAKIRPGSPAAAIGPGAAEGTLVTTIAFFEGIAVGGASISAFRLALSCSTAARVKASLSRPGPRGYRRGHFPRFGSREARAFGNLWQVPIHSEVHPDGPQRRSAHRLHRTASPHSTTSSAFTSSVRGTSMPSALAVLRLTARSNLVG
jgi:hypothetical protein